MEFLYLSTEKNVKTLKPDELTGRIYFYSTIGACLYNQKLYDKPGIYYVYKQDELQFDTSGSVSFTDVSFSDEINVSCIGHINYKGLNIDDADYIDIRNTNIYKIFENDLYKYDWSAGIFYMDIFDTI